MNEEAEKDRNQEHSPQQTVESVLEKFTRAARVEAVYHKPIIHGDELIIPAAEIVSAMGFGLGIGSETEAGKSDTGGGGGGGGSVFSRPVAVIVANSNGVAVHPIFDLTKVALAGMTTGIIILGTFARLLSLRRKVEKITDELMKAA